MTKLDKLTKDELLHLIDCSNSVKEILLKIGYKNTGTYLYNTFNDLLEKYCIENPNYKKSNKPPIENKYYEFNEIFIENSKFKNRCSMKKKLIRLNIFEYKCVRCNISDWMGEKITLQLEHKNGKNDDNRIENLELLCPNCHSQTSTYCGKNIKFDENFCDCGQKISTKKQKCRECVLKNLKEINLSNRKVKDRPTLGTILKNVEEFGYLGTGRLYGVSDSTIRKWIKWSKN